MPTQPVLTIRQETLANAQYRIRLTLKRPGQPDLEGEATIRFALPPLHGRRSLVG